MKRTIFRLILLVLTTALLASAVLADVIYEPMDDFYEAHRGECTYVNRSYTAAGPEGQVTIYESPESARVVTTMENEEQLYISYTYTDTRGYEWGCWEDWQKGLVGWVPMAYLTVIYDNISFWEDYGDSFVPTTGQLSAEYEGQTVYFWAYPGSDRATWTTAEEYLPEYSQTYTDADGRVWGYIDYYMGHRQCWICLDDPTADYEVLFANGPLQIQMDQSEPTYPAQTILPSGASLTGPITIAIAALVAATALMLVWHKKRSAGKS